MKFIYHCTLFILLLSGSIKSQAQYGFEAFNLPGAILRFQTGYSVATTSAEYEGVLRVLNNSGQIILDTPWKQTLNSTSTFGFTFGTYAPIKRLGKISLIGLSVNINYNSFKWDKIASSVYEGTDLSISGVTQQVAMPVSFDLKFGNDAILAKNNRFCASMGAGIQPSFLFTEMEATSQGTIGVNPFLKAEVGVLAGLCIKLQAKYEFGIIKDFELINKNNTSFEDDNLGGSFSMTGQPAFTFSVILMPFSWAWQQHGWWDTYQLK